jgi:DNA-binding CsgD family transcriptional regulator
MPTLAAQNWGFASDLQADAAFPSYIRDASPPPESAQRPGNAKPASVFWRGLTSGDFVLVEAVSDDSGCTATARERFGADSSALTDRELLLLHRAFQAEPQKNLAFGFDVSTSTVSQDLRSALTKLGLGRRVRSTPLAVVLAALNHCGAIDLPGVRFTCVHRGEQRHVVLGLPNLNMDLLGELTVAERKVALLLATGATTAQIAAQRGTSLSTVSNQIAALGGKLRVRGRFELISNWAERQWGMSAAAE